ncbi:hypothetical protein VNO77_16121 [Canavalia gladiata]|uniref:Uncharacterized protein n=1 Tax=Canavalia gladiata TaxID=3824 RepID=A0AAN9M5A3_CANGL
MNILSLSKSDRTSMTVETVNENHERWHLCPYTISNTLQSNIYPMMAVINLMVRRPQLGAGVGALAVRGLCGTTIIEFKSHDCNTNVHRLKVHNNPKSDKDLTLG